MEVLLDHGTDINAFEPQGFRAMSGNYPGSALHIAWCNLYDKIPFLTDREVDLHKKSENGFTPAELSLKSESEEVADVLLRVERARI